MQCKDAEIVSISKETETVYIQNVHSTHKQLIEELIYVGNDCITISFDNYILKVAFFYLLIHCNNSK